MISTDMEYKYGQIVDAFRSAGRRYTLIWDISAGVKRTYQQTHGENFVIGDHVRFSLHPGVQGEDRVVKPVKVTHGGSTP